MGLDVRASNLSGMTDGSIRGTIRRRVLSKQVSTRADSCKMLSVRNVQELRSGSLQCQNRNDVACDSLTRCCRESHDQCATKHFRRST